MVQSSNEITFFAAEIFRLAALIPALQLFFAAIVFSSFGHCICSLLLRKTPDLIIRLFLGQLALFVFFYFRTALCRFTGFGFSFIELLCLLTILIIVTIRLTDQKLHLSIKQLILKDLPEYSILLAVCWLTAAMELPRLASLSSDPDLHIFWADVVTKIGSIPVSLGLWGPENLNYPAGFAVLNSLWCYISFFDPLQIVNIQPVLQTLLAMLLLASAARRVTYSDNTALLACLQIFAVTLYFSLLPYSYQINFFHNEGTARTSSLFILTGMIFSFAAVFVIPLKESSYFLIVSSLCSVALIAIAPIHALYAAPCWLLSIICLLKISGRTFFATLTASLFIIFDPYYFIDYSSTPSPDSSSQISLIDSALQGLETSIQRPWHSISSAWNSYFSLDFTAPASFHKMFAAGTLAMILSKSISSRSWRVDLAFYTLLALDLIILSFLIVPGFAPLVHSSAYRLIQPYSIHLSQQIIYLLFAFQLILIAAAISSRLKSYFAFIAAAIILTAINLAKPEMGNLKLQPRYKISSGLGHPTENDFIVISQIKNFSNQILEKYPNIDSNSTPKILIPNLTSDTGWEQWLFPYGASRVLHIHSSLPLAFYYNQGQSEFSYNNYLHKVCKLFDIEWLKQRNVRYLFLPEQRGPICVRGLSKIEQSSELLFSAGNSRFYKLF